MEIRLVESGDNVLVKVKNLEVNIRRTDNGVVAGIWVAADDDGPIASTYAFFNEVNECHPTTKEPKKQG